jgi:hypothetical protein
MHALAGKGRDRAVQHSHLPAAYAWPAVSRAAWAAQPSPASARAGCRSGVVSQGSACYGSHKATPAAATPRAPTALLCCPSEAAFQGLPCCSTGQHSTAQHSIGQPWSACSLDGHQRHTVLEAGAALSIHNLDLEVGLAAVVNKPCHIACTRHSTAEHSAACWSHSEPCSAAVIVARPNTSRRACPSPLTKPPSLTTQQGSYPTQPPAFATSPAASNHHKVPRFLASNHLHTAEARREQRHTNR